MEIITIAADDHDRLIVHSGKLPRARLTWGAAGIEIYLLRVNAKNWHRAANIAMNHAISIHISPRSLQRRGK